MLYLLLKKAPQGVYLHNKWYQSLWWCAAKVMMYAWSLPSEGRESLNGSHTKILEKKERKEKPNKGILLMVLNNGVVRDSHEHRRAGFPWMCVRGWHDVPMDGVRETHGWCIDEVKSLLGSGERVGLVYGPWRGLEAHKEAETHTWGGHCWVTRVSEVPRWIKMRRMSG